MSRVAEYLMTNYYAHYRGSRKDIIPDSDTLRLGLDNHPEKIIVVEDGDIKGVAVFLTLTDRTYEDLENLDVTDVGIIKRLLSENGRNVHFILLAADSIGTILHGLRMTMRKIKPKTVSWFSPDMKVLHKFKRSA